MAGKADLSVPRGIVGLSIATITIAVALLSAAPPPMTVPAFQKLPLLPPLDLADMALWNWNAKWTAAQWKNDQGPIPWRYDRVRQTGRDVTFTVDADGAPCLKAQKGTPARTAGLWEVDATLPQMRDGLDVAPLYLYDEASKDEVDFEFAGRNGLDVTIHSYASGRDKPTSARLFAGRDFSGERMRFGIRADETAGYVDMLLNGQVVHRFDKSGSLPSHGLKPVIAVNPFDPGNAGYVSWLGRWAGLRPGEQLVMTVHGYRYTAI